MDADEDTGFAHQLYLIYKFHFSKVTHFEDQLISGLLLCRGDGLLNCRLDLRSIQHQARGASAAPGIAALAADKENHFERRDYGLI